MTLPGPSNGARPRGRGRGRIGPHSTAALAAAAALCSAQTATAQASPEAEGIVLGAWTFRPSFQVRIRGEYRRDPVDDGGAVARSGAVLREPASPVATAPPVHDQWSIGERARVGLGVERGPVTAVVILQDARRWGVTELEPNAAFGPVDAYIDLHTQTGRPVALRLGRQRVTWGDGRLVGESDWTPTARSLDAARFTITLGDLDLELLAAMLSTPDFTDDTPEEAAAVAAAGAEGGSTGAQLYGAHAAYHLHPLLEIEVQTLVRIVRDPHPRTLTPSNTIVAGARLSGDRRGLRYAVEGAYELGQVAITERERTPPRLLDLSAFAGAARVELETSLPAHLTFGVQGAYASGDEAPLGVDGTQTRFDPILPDQHRHHGLADLYAWSNLIEVGGDAAMRPFDALRIAAGYRLAALAEPTDQWTTEALIPVGAAPGNGSRLLGNEIDLALELTPWEPLRIDAGYSLFLKGAGADAILTAAARPASATSHLVYLQTTVTAP